MFFDKEHILYCEDINYTQPLQQHLALAVLRMHATKKERRITKKKKSRYSDPFLETTVLNTTKTTQ
jgi:hypothetical protein